MTPCIPAKNKPNPTTGYSMRWIDKVRVYEHRHAWEQVHGPIPDGLVIDHICHNPLRCKLGVKCPHRSCINVEHMVLVTRGENIARAWKPGKDKTLCPQGHPYDEENTYVDPRGSRHCRTCTRAAIAEWRRRKRVHA